MNSISPTNVNFSGINKMTYSLGIYSHKTEKPNGKFSEDIMKSVAKSDFIQKLAKKEDITLDVSTSAFNACVTVDVLKRGHINLWLDNTHLPESFERIQKDLSKIPNQLFENLIDINSKFSKKYEKAKNICAEMNKTMTGRTKYHTITQEKSIEIAPNLKISTEDIVIAKGIEGQHGVAAEKIIDVDA